MEITYDYYRIFYYAAKYKSFSKAAEILMSNQPNITHFMNNLENQLGCRLFIRSNRGVTLTREGEKLYKHVTIAYQHFQLAELELANDKSLQSGIITVGVSEIALLEKEPAYLPEGYDFAPVRKLRTKEVHPKYRIFTGITGFQLSNWYKNNRFCGRCGSKTVHSTTERALKCPSCGHVIYPRIVPAVIVGVCNGDEILVTKYRTGFAHYALVAGFTEIGETLEETVQREVMEETGLHVKNIRYYKSQPWGIVDDILAGFYCDVDGDTEIQMDESELKLAEWKKREDIVLQPDDFSLTNEMMLMFKKGKQ